MVGGNGQDVWVSLEKWHFFFQEWYLFPLLVFLEYRFDSSMRWLWPGTCPVPPTFALFSAHLRHLLSLQLPIFHPHPLDVGPSFSVVYAARAGVAPWRCPQTPFLSGRC